MAYQSQFGMAAVHDVQRTGAQGADGTGDIVLFVEADDVRLAMLAQFTEEFAQGAVRWGRGQHQQEATGAVRVLQERLAGWKHAPHHGIGLHPPEEIAPEARIRGNETDDGIRRHDQAGNPLPGSVGRKRQRAQCPATAATPL